MNVSMKHFLTAWVTLFVLIFAPRSFLMASDHIDGPVTIDHAVADITDLFAFPTPERPGHLTLILNVYTGVAFDGHFSEKVTCSFLVREARITGTAQDVGFETSGDYRIDCTFETPHGFNARHHVTCKSSAGTIVRVPVDEIAGPDSSNGLRVFAGHRSDPFFFNAQWAISASTKGVLLPPKDSNVMQDMNALSIVVEIDLEKELGLTDVSLLAVAAETTTIDGDADHVRQIDRVGRPEITNISMVTHTGKDLRDLYNAQSPFDNSEPNTELFRNRLRENIAFYDKLNGSLEWTEQSGNHLAGILVNDFLVVDVSRPYGANTFFEIEQSLLSGKPHSTCGGRVPNDDVVDVLFTLYINGGKEPQISDGVDRPTKLATDVFPYLAAPNRGPIAIGKNFFGRAAGKLSIPGRSRWMGAIALLSGVAALIGTALIVIFGVRLLVARICHRVMTATKCARSLCVIAVCFGVATICGFVTSAFSQYAIAIFAVICVGSVFLRCRCGTVAGESAAENSSEPASDARSEPAGEES